MRDGMTYLIYPNMRAELIGYLDSLADLDYQRRVWVDGGSFGNIVHDEMDYAIHFFYDDTKLASNPRETIGWFLLNEDEADLITKLVAAIDRIFLIYGMDLSDNDYISAPEWADVLVAAQNAKSKILPIENT
jgi:hypothetical protein